MLVIFLQKKILRIIRPGNGMHPKIPSKKFLGKRVSKDVKKGEALDWSHVLS